MPASLRGLSDPNAVRAAIQEYDRLGPEGFYAKYEYAPDRGYELVHEGQRYPCKLIAGAAFGIQHGNTLRRDQLYSGKFEAAGRLRTLGFTVEEPSEIWDEEEWVLALDVYFHGCEDRPRSNDRFVIKMLSKPTQVAHR
jgi:hypothetical protein